MAHHRGQHFSRLPQTFSSNFSGPHETSLDLTLPMTSLQGPSCTHSAEVPHQSQDTFSPDEQGVTHGRVHLLDPNVQMHPSSPLREISEKSFNGGICDHPNVKAAMVPRKRGGFVCCHPSIQINPSAFEDSIVSFSWML